MKGTITSAKIIFSLIGGLLGFMFGEIDGILKALIFLVTLDYATGFICACIEKCLSSEVGAKGIAKKVFIFVIVAVANIMGTWIFKDGSGLRTAVIFYYIANESLSITENAARMGIPIPAKLKAALEQLRDEEKGDTEDGHNTEDQGFYMPLDSDGTQSDIQRPSDNDGL